MTNTILLKLEKGVSKVEDVLREASASEGRPAPRPAPMAPPPTSPWMSESLKLGLFRLAGVEESAPRPRGEGDCGND